jgi:hypothetical protein
MIGGFTLLQPWEAQSSENRETSLWHRSALARPTLTAESLEPRSGSVGTTKSRYRTILDRAGRRSLNAASVAYERLNRQSAAESGLLSREALRCSGTTSLPSGHGDDGPTPDGGRTHQHDRAAKRLGEARSRNSNGTETAAERMQQW